MIILKNYDFQGLRLRYIRKTMFYKLNVEDHIRVPPHLFNEDVRTALITQVKAKYEGYISKDLGIVIDVSEVKNIGEGIIVPGDGAPYYKCTFELISFIPELQEVVKGTIKDIADFGAFLNIGPIDGMIHISQTMDDFVSFAKTKVLTGKKTNRSLKVEDVCCGRIIATSFKDISNPKIGVTMRQKGLGKIEWVEEDIGNAKPVAEAKK